MSQRLCAGLLTLWLAAPALAAPKESCRVVKEWLVGDVVAEHRLCEDLPKAAQAVPEKDPEHA